MEDSKDNSQAIRVLMERGDLSSLSIKEREALYHSVCNRLGLDPLFAPLSYLRLQGKLVLYLTRTATDQLARIHGLSREIIDGPRVITVEGTKMLYAVCRVRQGTREESAVATLPVQDPINGMMKLETKAKRRATLAILGLAALDDERDDCESGDEDVPSALPKSPPKSHPKSPPKSHPKSSPKKVPSSIASIPDELQDYADQVGDIQSSDQAAAVWLRYRDQIAKLSDDRKNQAWEMICARLTYLGVSGNVGRWLTAAIAKASAEYASRETSADAKAQPTVGDAVAVLGQSLLDELDELSSNLMNSSASREEIGARLARFWFDRRGSSEEKDEALFSSLQEIAKNRACRTEFDRFVTAGDNIEQVSPSNTALPPQVDVEQPATQVACGLSPVGADIHAPASTPPTDKSSSSLKDTKKYADPRLQALRSDLNKAVVVQRSISAACATWLYHAKLIPVTLKPEGYGILERALKMIEPSLTTDSIASLLTDERSNAVEKAKLRDFCGPVDLSLWIDYLETKDLDGAVAGSFWKRKNKLLEAHGKKVFQDFKVAAIARICVLNGCSEVEAATILSDVVKSNEKHHRT